MGLLDWFKGILFKLGLFHKEAKIVFLGLDNAGKSTLLHMLKYGNAVTIDPTEQPVAHEVKIEKITFKTFDLGGHEAARAMWEQYYLDTDAIVYLVDMADPERFPESKAELDKLLCSPELEHVPFLILANKSDAARVNIDTLIDRFGLMGQLTGKDKFQLSPDVRPLEVFESSVLRREGYDKGFRWLSNFLK